MSANLRWQLGLVLIAGTVFFTNLGGPRLWDEDEPRNAACAREMLAADDWVTPRFNGELRTHKPALVYWLMMSAYALFGVNEFAARFWSAFLGTATVWLTGRIGARLFGPDVGWWGGLALCGSLMFGVASRAATPDAVLIFCSTLALALFVSAADWSPRGAAGTALERARAALPPRAGHWIAVYAAMACGVLGKGPVGVVLPVLVLGVYLVCLTLSEQAVDRGTPRTWRECLQDVLTLCHPRTACGLILSLRPFTAALLVAAVAAPWYLWVGLRTEGAWLAGFLGEHNVGRFLRPMENHSGPIYYYLLAVMAGMLPWSIFLPLSVTQLVARLRGIDRVSRGDLFLCCWAGTYLAFFSLASTKLPSYVLPAYPPLALIVGRCLAGWIGGTAEIPRGLTRLAFGILAVLGLGFAVGGTVAARQFLPDVPWLGGAGLVPLTGGIVALWAAERGRRGLASGAFAASAAAFAVCLFGGVAAQVSPLQPSAPLIGWIQAHAGAACDVGAYGWFKSSVAFYAGKPVPKMGTPERAAEFLAQPNACLITRDARLAELQAVLPDDVVVLHRQPDFLREGDIVILGRRAATETLATTEAAGPR